MKYTVAYRVDRIMGEVREESRELKLVGSFIPLNSRLAYMALKSKSAASPYFDTALDRFVFKDIYYTMVVVTSDGEVVMQKFHHEMKRPWVQTSSLISHPEGYPLFESRTLSDVLPELGRRANQRVIQWIV